MGLLDLFRRTPPSAHVAKERLPLPPMDSHSEHGVHKAQSIRSAVGRGAGDIGDAGDVGCELRKDRQLAALANGRHEL